MSFTLPIVPSRGAPCKSRRSGHRTVHLIIFGEMTYRVSVVLTRKVHGLAKIYPITQLLASLDAQIVGSVISFHYPWRPGPVSVDRGHREEFSGVCHRGALEPIKESRQNSVQ